MPLAWQIWQGNTGYVACDHYHRYREDVGLMAEIGLRAYRFSISWPRILPEGTGEVNEKGLAFYDRLVDALLERDIQPWVTLFHWDYPLTLYRRGGWLNRDSADWFAEYVSVVVDRLSDRVTHWLTQNEIQCFVAGHRTGEHAPGLQLNWPDVLLAAHHGLLAHGKAVQTIRARARKTPCVGVAPVGIVGIPASESTEDIAAARARMFTVDDGLWNNVWFTDPMFLGHYPEDGLRLFGGDVPRIRPGDMETIHQPLDFYGVNIYSGKRVRAASNGGYETLPEPDGHPLTAMEWTVMPDALYWGPRFLYERYGLPIVVTENGLAVTDWVHLDGKVHDPQRIDFVTRYLLAYQRAIDDGVEAWGYFYWSLMDNFEWAEGYKRRFGLIYVVYQTQQRILKDSAYWYRDVIASNGATLGSRAVES